MIMKRLKDIPEESRTYKNEGAKVVRMELKDDEASKRLILHSAKRVIAVHKSELKKLAYK